MIRAMLVIGHRGAGGLAPENTLEALRAGLSAGADILELDVRLTSDHVPVVIHDNSTLRTHHQHITIANVTLADLEEKTPDQTVPTLSSVLDEFFGQILLNIELKSRGSGVVVADLIARTYIKKPSDWNNIYFSSFKAEELVAIRRANKHANLALLHGQNPFIFIAYHRKLQLTAVGFHRLYVNRFALEIAKKLGLFTYAYTVDRPYGALLLDRQGIDGVVTNRPDIILDEINKNQNQ